MAPAKQKTENLKKSTAVISLLKANLLLSIIVFVITAFLLRSVRIIATQLIKTVDQILVTQRLPMKVQSEGIMEPKNSREVLALKSESPPLTIGVRRLHFQYSSVLPQTYLTLISVLQGVAFGILLTKIPFPEGDSWATLTQFLLQRHFYLPYIVSSLIILVIWSQFVHVCLFLTWPFSLLQSTLIFFLSLVEVLAFNNINTISNWLICLGLIGLVGGVIRLNNLKFLTPKDVDWEPTAQDAAAIYRRSQKLDGAVYLSSGAIVMLVGLFYNRLTRELGSLVPALMNYVDWVVLLLLFAEMCIILLVDIRFRRSFLRQLTDNSELVVSSHGVVRYRK